MPRRAGGAAPALLPARDNELAWPSEVVEVVAQFRPIAELSAYGMAVCTPAGRYVIVNEPFARMVGRPVSDLLTLHAHDITHSDDRAAADSVADAAVAQGLPSAMIDKRFVRPDGSVVHARVSVTIIRDRAGTQLCYVTQVTDLTELREAQARAEQSEARARRVVTSSADAYISIDAAGVIREWNPAAVRLFGWSRAAAMSQPLADLIIPGHLRTAHRAGLERHARTGEARVLGRPVELLALRADGTTIAVEVTIWASADGDGPAGYHAFLRDVSERAQVAATARRHSLVYASITDAVFLTGADGLIIEANPAAENLFGRRREQLIGATSTDLLDPDTEIRTSVVRAAALADGFWSGDVSFTRPDGQPRISAALIRPVTGIDGDTEGFLAVHRDVTEARRASAALVEAEARYRLLAENSSDIISQVALDGTVLYVSPSYERVFGRKPGELIGGRIAPHIHPDDEAALHEGFARVAAGESARLVSRRQHADGSWLWLESSNEPMRDPNGEIIGVQSAVRDVTARKTAEADLERLALSDVLTGLANRARLADRLHLAQQRLHREPAHLALLVIDLDGFKTINDTHGHLAGDAALVEVAVRLHHCARPTDTVARLGGDEFAVLLDGLPDDNAAVTIAGRILTVLRQPLDLPEYGRVDIRASIGIAVTHDPARPAEQLHQDADAALYRAKAAGRDQAVKATRV